MRCPTCGGAERVLEKVECQSWDRRRRVCIKCGARFSTYEVVDVHVEIVTAPGVRARRVRIVGNR